MHNPKHTLPNGWSLKKLGEIFEFLKTESLSREQLTYEETNAKVRYIHYGDIHAKYKNQILDFKQSIAVIPFVKDEAGFASNTPFLKDGDLVIADASEDYEGIGECIELKNVGVAKVIGGLHTIAIRDVTESTAVGFRAYLFKNQSVSVKVKQYATGISVYGISKSSLSKLEIPLPPLAEQQKIAAILGTWDTAIHTTTTLLATLQKRKKGLMQRLLSPKEEQRMIEIGEIASELSIRNKKGYDFTVLSCTKYEGLVDSLKYFGRKIYSDDLSTYKIVPQNAFAYATNHIEEGSIGYQRVYQNALISPMYTVFKTSDLVDDSYLFFVLKSDRYIKIYQQNMSGSIDRRGALRWVDFAKLKIPFPPLAEQIRIAEILNAADAEIRETKAYLEQLKAQKRGLMQQLLTGKVRVKTT